LTVVSFRAFARLAIGASHSDIDSIARTYWLATALMVTTQALTATSPRSSGHRRGLDPNGTARRVRAVGRQPTCRPPRSAARRERARVEPSSRARQTDPD